MDSEQFRAILSRSGVGIWSLIDAAIKLACSDYGEELRRRRHKIVESLYSPAVQICQNCNGNVNEDAVEDEQYYPQYVTNNCNSSDNYVDDCKKKFDDDGDTNNNNNNRNGDFSKSPFTPESSHQKFSAKKEEVEEEEDDFDPFVGLFDDEQTKILSIKEQLEDPNQTEDSVIDLLQNLTDMDITFEALKETDIGRHVNLLRKHPSNEIRRMVKLIVRKWKETVDEWVKVDQPQGNSNIIADEDSPQQSIPKNRQNGHHQVPDCGYTPYPQNRSTSAERNYAETETKSKSLQYAEAQSRRPPSVPKPASAPPNRVKREPIADDERLQRLKREPVIDDERLSSARKRLQENYQEAQNAKKQRTIQVMDIHEIPKPKNGFIARNKGGFHGRNHR